MIKMIMKIPEYLDSRLLKVEGGLELGCWKEFSRARDLAPNGTRVGKPCVVVVVVHNLNDRVL